MQGNWLRWQTGRQQSGYQKRLLIRCRWLFKFDIYLLKFPFGSEIASHTDEVIGGRHFRLNLILKHAQKGGEFICSKGILNCSRLKLFRPNITPHGVSKVLLGTRLVLSIGWVRS